MEGLILLVHLCVRIDVGFPASFNMNLKFPLTTASTIFSLNY